MNPEEKQLYTSVALIADIEELTTDISRAIDQCVKGKEYFSLLESLECSAMQLRAKLIQLHGEEAVPAF